MTGMAVFFKDALTSDRRQKSFHNRRPSKSNVKDSKTSSSMNNEASGLVVAEEEEEAVVRWWGSTDATDRPLEALGCVI